MSRLIVESGNEAGIVFPITQDTVMVGRSSSATLQVIDKRVSRYHVMLSANRESYHLEDLGSKNGTLLNGEPLVGPVSLKSGDRIQVGDTVLIFEREPGGDAPATVKRKKSGPIRLVPGEIGARREQMKVDTAPLVKVDQPVQRELVHDPFERLKVIYEVSHNISSELHVSELLDKIMDLIWNIVAPHRGIILLRDEKEGLLDPVVVRSRDGDIDEITISSSVIQTCVSEQSAVLVSDAPSDLNYSANESIIVGRIRSVIAVPLICQAEVLGVIYIDSQEAGTVYYTNDDLELLTGIANQAALAISNARLHTRLVEQEKLEKEMEIARSIQMNLLPKAHPEIPGLEVCAMSIPARQVGGDYYDFVQLEDGRTAIIIADVSGKGVPAAIFTATVRASIRAESHNSVFPPVHQLVKAVNRWTCRDISNNMFVTMVYAVFDPKRQTLDYTNAGHCFPIIFKPNGTSYQLEKGGCFLGIMEEVEYEDDTIQLETGDTLVFYTDGVTDVQNSERQLYGFDRFLETIQANLHLDCEQLRDKIYDEALTFRGQTDQFDDLTLIVARV